MASSTMNGGSPSSATTSRRCAPPSWRGYPSRATSCGPCSTTSSGQRAIRSASGSSTSTSRPRRGPRKRAPRGMRGSSGTGASRRHWVERRGRVWARIGGRTTRRGVSMRRLRLLSLLSIVLLIGGACKAKENEGGATGGPKEANTGKVNVLAAVEPEEADALQGIADQTITGVDYTVEFEAAGNFEQDVQVRGQGGTLDVILLPQPGSLPGLVTSAHAVSLEDMGYDIGELEATFGKPFMDLGLVDGKHYGIPTNINLKSMIWYPKDDFDKAGYKVPTTWDELMALSDQIVADGSTPWCVGFQSEGSTGWPATDWLEVIMLRTGGPEPYVSG